MAFKMPSIFFDLSGFTLLIASFREPEKEFFHCRVTENGLILSLEPTLNK
jgi:hypothetical protein